MITLKISVRMVHLPRKIAHRCFGSRHVMIVIIHVYLCVEK